MDKRDVILSTAEQVFCREGFRATGVDRLLEPAGASTRTLYKHFGSKNGLALAILKGRDQRFFAAMNAVAGTGPVSGMFDVLLDWMGEEGAVGCPFLRALGEYHSEDPEIAAFAQSHKQRMRAMIAERVETAVGAPDPRLADQVWLLFEGAVSAAAVAGDEMVNAAQNAAEALVAAASKR